MGTTNYHAGYEAENVAAQYLKKLGYKIIERNWQTPRCEIDIIVSKHSTVYFVEVKYRKTNLQGGGLDYITPKKLTQMQFAAQSWVSSSQYEGEYQLSALEVSGDDFEVTNFLPDIL